MAIIGAMRDGLTGDYTLLAIKSLLDGFSALAFASSLGIGVIFSSLSILVYQGSLALGLFHLSAQRGVSVVSQKARYEAGIVCGSQCTLAPASHERVIDQS